MAIIDSPGIQIAAGIETQFPPNVATPPNFKGAYIELLDTNGEWGNVVDNTRHITRWGFQHTEDGGSNWVWGPADQQEPGGLPFGVRRRDGGMPSISVTSDDIQGGVTRLRVTILTDSNIQLGVEIRTGADVPA